MKRILRTSAIGLLALTLGGNAFAARFIIRNTNSAGVGFNDATPVEPVGGNPGRTIGEQRMNAFQYAANIWGALLDSPVDIVVDASFDSLDCTATSGVLGAASPTVMRQNFPNAPQANVLYPIALANKLAKTDLQPETADIRATFNSKLDQPSCLGGVGWYYGYDGNHGVKTDFIVVLLHEMGHGLGFISNYNSNTGGFFNGGTPTAYDLHLFDRLAGMSWTQMNTAQRLASAVDDQNVIFDGTMTNAAATKVLGPTPTLKITAPSPVAKSYAIGLADFGGKVSIAGVTASVAAATDAAETIPNDSNVLGTTTDGCSAFSNASAVAGKIALIDRGYCKFAVKAKNAQDAGAIGVIIADNVAGTSAPGLGASGTSIDAQITIPVISVTQADGAALRAQINNGVSATIFADPLQLAGADSQGRVKIYVPSTFRGGSSVSHWDISANPNLLMEPNISDDLSHGVDLTLQELIDIGWTVVNPQGRTILRRR